VKWWKEHAFGLYPLHESTGAPSFAFFAKGGIVRSYPSTSNGKQTCSLGKGFRLGPFVRRNPGLESETWATHSESGGCALIFDRLLAGGSDRHNALRQIEAAQRKLRRGAVGGAQRILEIDLTQLARQQ
jgi:hypothetical protein